MKSVAKGRKMIRELFVERGQTSNLFKRQVTAKLISLVLLCFSVLGGLLPTIAYSAEASAETESASDFHRAFAAADGMGKRDLVIKAIDSNLIHTGLTFSEILKLFPDMKESELVD
jgi:hypothetical protein